MEGYKKIIALLVLLLMGCGTPYWHSTHHSLNECRQDYMECQYEASKATAGIYGPPISAGVQSGIQKSLLIDQCMKVKGYLYLLPEEGQKMPSACPATIGY